MSYTGGQFIDGFTIVGGSNQIFRGNKNTITGSNVIVYGDDNYITGSNVQVWGNCNRIIGSGGRVMSGNDNVIVGANAIIQGNGTGNTIELFNELMNNSVRVGNLTSFTSSNGDVHVSWDGPVHIGNGSAASLGPVVVYASDEKKKKKKSKKYVEGPLPTDVEHDKVSAAAEEDNAKTCIICLERAPCCVAYPCMHASYCVACARTLCFGESGTELYKRGKVKCAQCREKVNSIKRIFI